MAVTQVVEHEATTASGKSERPARQPGAAWSTPSQLRKSMPIVRLVAEIWAIPQVQKIGLLVDEDGVQVRVLMANDERDARAKVYDAEREYLNGTSPHDFNLRVVPLSKAGDTLPPSFQTILER